MNMQWIRTILTELIGLFIDDGNLAIAVLLWLAACWLIFPVLGLPSAWLAVLLFAGLVMILAWSAVRRAGQPS